MIGFNATSSTWRTWTPISDCLQQLFNVGAPAVVSPDGSALDIFLTGADQAVWHGVDQLLSPFSTGQLRPPACPSARSLDLAVVLCEYSDAPGIPLQDGSTTALADKAYFSRLLAQVGTGGMSDFYSAQSYGNVNFLGSTILDWATTSAKYSDAQKTTRPNNGALTCLNERQSSIDLNRYDGVIVVMNKQTDSGAVTTGPYSLTLNGVTRNVGFVVTSPTGFSISFMGHEMGHAMFGLAHSFDAGSTQYGDIFDLMSCFNCGSSPDPNFATTGPNLNAGTRAWLGWMSPRRIVSYAGTALTTDIAAVDHPEVDAPLMVRIPLNDGSGSYYTLEMRRTTDKVGVDKGLVNYPYYEFDPVVLHRVESNGNTHLLNYGSGRQGGFQKGDSWTDSTAKVTIKVTNIDGANDRATVSVSPST